jgi:hypothetical protein
MDEKKPDAAKAEDVVLLHSPTEDGAGMRVLRAREGRLEAGVMRPLEEGKPIVQGEVVKLTPRHREGPDAPVLCDVEVQYAPPPAAHSGKPVQVASKAYRESWDRIFEGAAPEATVEVDQRRLN